MLNKASITFKYMYTLYATLHCPTIHTSATPPYDIQQWLLEKGSLLMTTYKIGKVELNK